MKFDIIRDTFGHDESVVTDEHVNLLSKLVIKHELIEVILVN